VGTPALNGLVLACLAAALVASLPPVQRTLFDPRPELIAAPVAAAHWLAANPQSGRMFNYQRVVTSRQATPALIALLESSGRWRLAFSMGDQLVYQRVEGGRT